MAIYKAHPKKDQISVTSIASLAAAYLQHCDGYHIDENGRPTHEVVVGEVDDRAVPVVYKFDILAAVGKTLSTKVPAISLFTPVP